MEATSIQDASQQLSARGIQAQEIHVATTQERTSAVQPSPLLTREQSSYLPLIDTLRLYAGWLLAWYGLVYLLGFYRSVDRLSVDLPFIDELYQSALVLRFAFGTFLFLLLTSIHRLLRGGLLLGCILLLAGIAVMLLFAGNV